MHTTHPDTTFNLGDKIQISPSTWPNGDPKIQPGDLSVFAPTGDGVYGYQGQNRINPFKVAPPLEESGGVIYFGNEINKADFEALMRIMGVQPGHAVKPAQDFAVFATESHDPKNDGYLAQVRVVSKFGLRFMFGALTDAEYESFPEQKTTIVETLWSFIQHERERWGTSFWQDREKGLQGLFGGDGNYAREELSFGFMLENGYYRVCRIWSRAWLVTK